MSDLDFGSTITSLEPGQQVFDRFTLKRILGRGGMGVVWLAKDGKLEREVALKFLPETVVLDPKAIDDLKRETRRALALTHEHIVRIYDFVDDSRRAAISMEFVEGMTLAKLSLEKPDHCFQPAELGVWVGHLASALTYAHQKAKVVHRDLKPANLMVDTQADLRVADFGISASITDTVSRASRLASNSGSPAYMSPQQLMGEKPAVTDDIYSVGATLYELLTSKPPFYTGNVLLQVQNKVPPSVTERRQELEIAGDPVPSKWEETIAACLAKDPKDRPQSAAEVAERLNLATKSTKSAKTVSQSKTSIEPKVERGVPAALGSGESKLGNPKSKIPLIAGLAAAVLLLGGLGWYFGSYAPEQRRLEMARLEAEGRAAEALKHKNEQERLLTEQKTKAEQERLAAARGGIVIRTNPSGAEVRVGAVALDKSPLTLKDQKLGKYPVRVRLDDYEDWDGEVEVKENEFADLDVALVRSTGVLDVESEPAGVEFDALRVSEKLTPTSQSSLAQPKLEFDPPMLVGAKTPRSEKLATGIYTVRFRRMGWPEQEHTIALHRNQRTTVSAEFSAGRLELTSSPAGAEVWQNGRHIGGTPYTVADAVPGRYSYELRLKGYKAGSASLTVAAKQTARETIDLEKIVAPETGRAFVIPEIGLTIMPISPGSFTMGSSSGGDSDERPVTQVRISQPFWLGKTEVTQAQWEALMGSNPSHFKGADRPVEQVSWDEAMAFCRKLTERERAAGRLPDGYAYTLPTETQWEFACRAGTAGDYASNLEAMGWYDGNSGNQTHSVGQKQANAWGMHDMHGNVWEWCADWYGSYPGGSVTDPAGVSSGSIRVNRGGSWIGSAGLCRSAVRSGIDPGFRRGHLGFRVALAPTR